MCITSKDIAADALPQAKAVISLLLLSSEALTAVQVENEEL